jgi:transposase
MPFSFESEKTILITPKRIPEETKQRAMRLGFGAGTLRRWVREAQIDAGQREGLSSNGPEKIRRWEREDRELRQATAIHLPHDAQSALGP